MPRPGVGFRLATRPRTPSRTAAPWAPITSACSMSAVLEGPARKSAERGRPAEVEPGVGRVHVGHDRAGRDHQRQVLGDDDQRRGAAARAPSHPDGAVLGHRELAGEDRQVEPLELVRVRHLGQASTVPARRPPGTCETIRGRLHPRRRARGTCGVGGGRVRRRGPACRPPPATASAKPRRQVGVARAAAGAPPGSGASGRRRCAGAPPGSRHAAAMAVPRLRQRRGSSRRAPRGSSRWRPQAFQPAVQEPARAAGAGRAGPAGPASS